MRKRNAFYLLIFILFALTTVLVFVLSSQTKQKQITSSRASVTKVIEPRITNIKCDGDTVSFNVYWRWADYEFSFKGTPISQLGLSFTSNYDELTKRCSSIGSIKRQLKGPDNGTLCMAGDKVVDDTSTSHSIPIPQELKDTKLSQPLIIVARAWKKTVFTDEQSVWGGEAVSCEKPKSPPPDNVQQAKTDPNIGKKCDNNRGTCQNANTYKCSGSKAFKTGLCPGPANIKCCTVKSTDSGGGGGENTIVKPKGTIVAKVQDPSGKAVAVQVIGLADCDKDTDSRPVCSFSTANAKKKVSSYRSGAISFAKREFIGAFIKFKDQNLKLVRVIDDPKSGSHIERCHNHGEGFDCVAWPKTALTGGTFTATFVVDVKTPNPNPNPDPDPNPCPRKSEGDANCDGTIDFAIDLITNWRAELLGEKTSKNADFNGDDVVNIEDIVNWRNGFLR